MSIESLIKDINKTFGDGAIKELGLNNTVAVEVIPFGIKDLDVGLIGCGGLPLGRIVEVYGAESSGKTTLALTAVANAQKLGHTCAYIDTEHALDPSWATTIGVDTDKLFVSQPDGGEQALQIVQKIAESGAVKLIVVDSVAALTPRAELDGEIGDAVVGAQARLMSQAMRKLVPIVSNNKCVLLFINQTRDKIGVSFGSPTTTPGGRALRFAASLRIEVTRIGSFKKGDEILGNTVKIKIAKNKLGVPFKTAEFQLRFDSGFDIYGNILDDLITQGQVTTKGAWFFIGDTKLQGRENMIQWLKENYEQ